MTSKTTKTRCKRTSKQKKMGRERKNALNNHGTTKTSKELFQVASS